VALLDEVRAIASTGLHYSTNPFDRERYERLLELAAQEYAERSSLGADEIRARFDAHIGYVSASVGADAAIFDDDDRILLVRRVDDGRWGLIAGWVDSNESPEATVVREIEEEVGLQATVDELVGVFFRPASFDGLPHGTVSIVYLCSVIGGTLRTQPHEVHEAVYCAVDDVADWHHHHESLARAALDAHRRRRAGI
jgi:8-oxo-dGTP pyrophosphatase MutT (NUDIX family)